jgi:hypothetical protein
MQGLKVHPSQLYDGAEFDEYCISEARYLPASRDRTPCLSCPLNSLCQAGFEEQIRRLQAGENPSLTEGCAFRPDALGPQQLFNGLTEEQKNFVVAKIPSLADRKIGENHHE